MLWGYNGLAYGGTLADAGLNSIQYHIRCMELQTPAKAQCPMCEDETVTVEENKNGKPYFTCRSDTCNTTVNLNGENSTQMLKGYLINDGSGEDDGEALGEADEPDDDATLEDILGGDDDE